MSCVVIGSQAEVTALFAQRSNAGADIIHVPDLPDIKLLSGLTTIVDLSFDETPARIAALTNKRAQLIVVNCVTATLMGYPEGFIRINGWPGFLERPVVEITGASEGPRKAAEVFFNSINKSVEWVADDIGMITPRVVSCIVNEAYLALEEAVSTKEEIDIAMKMGTNYPFGPFEWAEKIGHKNIYRLLEQLSETDPIYQPSALLKEAALG